MHGLFVMDFLENIDIWTVLVFVVVLILFYNLLKRNVNLPPGPFLTLPIVGNTLQLAGKDPLMVFKDMRKKYGDVFSIASLGNELVVVLNGYETVREALLKRARVFSHRPENYLSQDVLENKGLASVSGEFWHEQRHFTLSCLKKNGFNKTSLEERIMREVESLQAFLEINTGQNLDLSNVIKMSSFNIIMDIIASRRYTYDERKANKYLSDLDEVLKIIIHGGTVVNSFPILKYLPGDPFKLKLLNQLKISKRSVTAEIYDEHETTIDPSNPRDFIDHYILEVKRKKNINSNFTRDQCLFLFEDLIGAGTDTTGITILWTIWHLRQNPEIQKKLQLEILNAIGHERPPTLQDQSKMPYVEATILESLRISYAVPLSVPHATSEDTTFRGYNIPKGSTVLINLHSVFTDPVMWDNSEEFRPERFLDADGKIRKRDDFIPFSMGKRVCLGEVLARAELFLIITSMYQKFSFLNPERTISEENSGILGVTFNPKPFKVSILKGTL